jgi:putative peptidoglycan lipid II flippase
MKSISLALLFFGFSRVILALKDLGIAYFFGTQSSADLYFLSLVVPSFVLQIYASIFGAAFIPEFIRIKEQAEASDVRYFLSSTFSCTLIAAVIALGLSIGISLLVAHSFYADRLREDGEHFYYLLMSFLVMSGIVRVFFESYLNALGHFRVAIAVSCLSPIIVLSWLFFQPSTKALFFSTIVSSYIELFILIVCSLSRGLPVHALRFLLDFKPVVRFMRQAAQVFGGAVFQTSSEFVDQTMASSLGRGSIATLNYGSKITASVLTIFSGSLRLVLLPRFSQLNAEKKWKELRAEWLRWTGLTLSCGAGFVVLLIIFSRLIVRLIFERGAFSAFDSQIVSNFQIYYAIQVPFFLAGVVSVWLLNALQRNLVLTYFGIINFITNIGGNFILMRTMGASGIALATSLVFVISWALLFIRCWTIANEKIVHGDSYVS